MLFQITPDNFENKKSELTELMFSNLIAKDESGFEEQDSPFELDEHKIDVAVKTIVRKAQTNHSMANFYASVCFWIVHFEINYKELEPTEVEVTNCIFMRDLLKHLKESLVKLLNAQQRVG